MYPMATNPTAADGERVPAVALPFQANDNDSIVDYEEVDEDTEMPEMVNLEEQKEGVVEMVFVAGLPQDASEKDVEKLFEKVGGVVCISMGKHPISNDGFAYVNFATAEQARKAVTGFKGIEQVDMLCD